MRYVVAVAVLISGVAMGQELPEDTNEIKTLTVDQAQALAQREGCLSLDGLTTLSPEVAQALSRHEGWLSLDGLNTLSPEVAKAMAQHQGALFLNGLTSLSDEAAKALAEHEAVLGLDGLTRLSGPAADVLRAAGHDVPVCNQAESQELFPAANWPIVTADDSPWQIESDAGIDDSRRVIDNAISTTLGEVSHAFKERSFRGITLGEKHVMQAGPKPLGPDWLLPIHTPDDAGRREADVTVLVDAQSKSIVGVCAVYQEPITALMEDIKRAFGDSTEEIDERLGFSDLNIYTLKYSFPNAIVRVQGSKIHTRIVVLDRNYVEQSLRPYANAVLAACRWAKQVLRYGQHFEPGPLPPATLADLKSAWNSNRSALVLSDNIAQKIARQRHREGQSVMSEWDAAAGWWGESTRGVAVNFQVGTTTGIPLLLTSRDDYARRTLTTAGTFCPDLFHDVGNVLLQHEFPPSGDTISVLNAKKMWDPDDTLIASSAEVKLDPQHECDDEVIERRFRDVVERGDAHWVRCYQWTDKEGWLISFTESLVLTVARETVAPRGL